MSSGTTQKIRESFQWIETDPIEQRMRDLDAAGRESLLAAQSKMSGVLQAAGLNFEGLPYPVSARPLAITETQANVLASMGEKFVRLLDVAAALYLKDPDIRSLFSHCESVARHITAVPGLKPLVRVCRLDTMLASDGNYRIVETNAECPGGVIQGALATRIWEQTDNPLMRGLAVDGTAQPFVLDPDCFCHTLVDSHGTLTGQRPTRAAIVNFKGRFTNEVSQILESLDRLDIDAVLIDAADIRPMSPGVADRTGECFDFVYNKLDPRDLLNEPSVTAYLAAVAAGEVTCLNPLIAQFILADKVILAVLSDERFANNFTQADRALIRKHVPWTRAVRSGKTLDLNGKPTDLLAYIAENPKKLVLKPSNATRGEGAIVGLHTHPDEWERHIALAARSVPYVVQEYLPGSVITAPNPMTGTIDTMTAGLDIYVFGGRFAGFHARASLDPVINIGKRGMLLPVAVMKGTVP